MHAPTNGRQHAETPCSGSEDGEDEQAQDSGGSGDPWWEAESRPGLGFNASSAAAVQFAGSSLEHALQGLLGQDLEATGKRGPPLTTTNTSRQPYVQLQGNAANHLTIIYSAMARHAAY